MLVSQRKKSPCSYKQVVRWKENRCLITQLPGALPGSSFQTLRVPVSMVSERFEGVAGVNLGLSW